MSRPQSGREAVAVVSGGVKAPGGATLDELWESLCAGRACAVPFHDDRLPPGTDVLICPAAPFDAGVYLGPAELRRTDRTHQLGIAAAQDAIDAFDGQFPEPERCAVVCGVGHGPSALYEARHVQLLDGGLRALPPLTVPYVMPSSLAGLLSMRFGFRGPSLTVSSACASGATAIGEGVELLRRGAADLVLAGGVDSMISYNVLCGFLRLDAMSHHVADPALASRPFDRERDGFVVGEGAAFVVLRRENDVRAAGEPSLGSVIGYGLSSDAHHIVAPAPRGEGALRCMRLALSDAGVAASDVAHVNAHGTSTVLNDQAEALALDALFDGAVPPVTSVKGTTGHLIGGSGAVEALVALRSMQEQLVPPVSGLREIDPVLPVDVVTGSPRPIGAGLAVSNSFGFGGSNAVLVLAPG